MKKFFRVFTILTRKQMMLCSFIIFLMALCAMMEAFGIGLVYPLIRIIGNPNFLDDHKKIEKIMLFFGVNTHRRLIFVSSLCLLCFYIFKNLVILYEGKLQIAFSMSNQKDYTRRLYSYYMSKPYLFMVDTNIAIVLRNINVGGATVFCSMLVSVLSIITDFITIFVIWIFLAFMDWMTAFCIVLFIAPFVFAILNYFRKKIGEYGSIQTIYSAEMSKWVNQGFYSLKETKVMQRENFFTERFYEAYSKYTDSMRDYQFIQRVPKAIIELTTIGGILLLVAAKMLFKGDPNSLIPSLGVLALAAVRIMPSLNRIIALFNDLKFHMPLFNEIYDDMIAVKRDKDFSERKIFKPAAKPMEFKQEISVENLSFAYPSKADNYVLKNVTFKIPKGSFCGIVGPSGAGKTTFVDILLGLLPPNEGTIYVDGQDIYENPSGWLNNVAYVPQSIYLIDGTIRDNIAFGHDENEIDDEKLERVLKMAEFYDFVQTLPEGVKTNVGDRGSKLSGGQRQRIGIARALYNDPSVLVLDEATSALDNETEKQITETILKLKGKMTIIAIAHRLSTLEECDFKIEFKKCEARIV